MVDTLPAVWLLACHDTLRSRLHSQRSSTPLPLYLCVQKCLKMWLLPCRRMCPTTWQASCSRTSGMLFDLLGGVIDIGY